MPRAARTPRYLARHMGRLLRNTLLAIAAVVGLLLGGLLLLGSLYEDDAKRHLLSALNERLTTPVEVARVDLTLIRRFPRASLRLHHVLARERRSDGQEPDTLLHARDLYLEFSLLDLLRGTYAVESVHGVEVIARPGRDRHGEANYLVWRSTPSETPGPRIAIRQATFDGLTVRWADDEQRLRVTGHTQHIAVKGALGSGLNELFAEGDLRLVEWIQDDARVLADRDVDVRLKMTFGGDDGAFRIVNGEVWTRGVRLTTTLAVSPTAGGTLLDLRAAGERCDLQRIADLLPPALQAPLRPYGLAGEADVVLRYSGEIGPRSAPALELQLTLRDTRMKEERSGTAFTNIHGRMDLHLDGQGHLRALVLKDLRAKAGSGDLRADLDWRGGKAPHLKGGLRADLRLDDLLRFARIDTLEQVGGRIKADIQLAGSPGDLTHPGLRDLRALSVSGTLALRNASLKLKGVRHRITGLDADLALNGNDARINSLHADLQGSPIQLSGDLVGLLPYLLLDDQRLTIRATGRSERVDLAEWLREEPGARRDQQPATYALRLPAELALDLEVAIGTLVFEGFSAEAITGHVVLKDRVLRAEPVRFTTAGGTVAGGLALDGRDARTLPLDLHADLQRIDISRLFAEFNDFGQDFIGHRHLRGTAGAQVRLYTRLSSTMAMDLDALRCTADLVIDRGGLKDHGPLMEVAGYVRQNKLVAPFVNTNALEQRLADIAFDRLENRIEIRDRQVIVPLMEVRSTAMDIEVSGRHGFDDRIDHRLNFRLADLFRNGPLQDEFGPVIDDGTGMRLFLRMQGLAGDPHFSTDSEMAALRRGRQWQQEKQRMRDLFRQEFAGKANPEDDRTVSAGGATATPRFDVEWTGDTATTAPPAAPRRKGRNEPPPQVRFEVED